MGRCVGRVRRRMGAAARVAGLAALLAGAAGQAAAQVELYDGSKARVNLAAKLRSLTEELTGSICRVHSGIATEAAQSGLETASREFDLILTGLLEGSPALGVPTPEKFSDNLRGIASVREAARPLQETAGRMLGSAASEADFATVETAFRPLLDSTVDLTSRISGHYSNPQELLQREAITLDFMVRQQMLANRMARVLCGLVVGSPAMGSAEELSEAVNLFDLTLVALRDGMPEVGIEPPQNRALQASLASTYELWSSGNALFTAAAGGGAVEPAVAAEAAEFAGTLGQAMNNVITLYLISSPGKEGVYRVPLEAYAETELSKWITHPDLVAAVVAQNARHSGLTQAEVEALDQQWRAEEKGGGGPLIDTLLGTAVSAWLLEQQGATAGLVTEVFVMDNKGLNVAQSVVTSDYWQGDEAKWIETYGSGSRMHISDVEFDDSTGFYQSQVSLSIADPASGRLIGAITFGVNVQRLM